MQRRAVTKNVSKTALPSRSTPVAACQCGDRRFAKAGAHPVPSSKPTDPSASRALSNIAQQTGRHEEAVQLLRSFARTSEEYSNLGVSLDKIGQRDEAEVAYRKAIALDPDLAAAHFNLGNLL